MLTVRPTRERTVYVASASNTVWVTRTAGESWFVSQPLPSQVLSVYADATHIYAGTENGVFRLPHGLFGAVWEGYGLDVDVVPAPPPAWAYLANVVTLTSASAADPLWAGTTQGLHRRRPGDQAWEVVLERPGAVSDVLVDPTCPRRVYAAMGLLGQGSRGAGFRHGGGVWFSSDEGETWQSMTAGSILDRIPITDVEMDPSEPDVVYVATFGRGVWRWRWGQPPTCGGGPQ